MTQSSRQKDKLSFINKRRNRPWDSVVDLNVIKLSSKDNKYIIFL